MAPRTDPPAPPVPTEAVDYLRRKKVRQGFHYDEVWREEHWRSFTVAKAMEDDLLSDIQGSIAGAIEEGVPFEKWRAEMTERLGKRGWWGYKVDAEPEDEEQRAKLEANLSRRLETIWHVNTTQAYQAGIWERGMRSPAHPYVLYLVGPSAKHREQHLAWHGTLLPRDDPFWAIAAPMNGWGCKCSVRFVSRAARQRYLRDKIPGPVQGDAEPDLVEPKTAAPTLQPKTYQNKRTKQTHVGYAGIDPGFERSPGVGRARQLEDKFRQSDRRLAEGLGVTPTPARPAAPDQPAVQLVSAAFSLEPYEQTAPKVAARLERTLQAIDEVHSDGDLPQMPVITGSVEGSAGMASLGVLVGVDPAKAYPELSLAHEVAHQLEWWLRKRGADMADLLAVIEDTVPIREARTLLPVANEELQKTPDDEEMKALVAAFAYLGSRREMFARAYAQYVAWRSGDAALLSQIDAELADESFIVQHRQWPYAEFLPIALQFDMLFERVGWLTRT